jgi:hypothetical protein
VSHVYDSHTGARCLNQHFIEVIADQSEELGDFELC